MCKKVKVTATLNQLCKTYGSCNASNNEECTCMNDGTRICHRPHNAPGLFVAEQVFIFNLFIYSSHCFD